MDKYEGLKNAALEAVQQVLRDEKTTTYINSFLHHVLGHECSDLTFILVVLGYVLGVSTSLATSSLYSYSDNIADVLSEAEDILKEEEEVE